MCLNLQSGFVLILAWWFKIKEELIFKIGGVLTLVKFKQHSQNFNEKEKQNLTSIKTTLVVTSSFSILRNQFFFFHNPHIFIRPSQLIMSSYF